MSKHLLSCACGQALQVDSRQAGQQVTCSCGTKVDVPPLRQLRELPEATEIDEQSRPAWTVRHGLITAALLLAIGFATFAGYSWYTAPSPPKFDPGARTRVVERGIESLTPADGWKLWMHSYVPLVHQGLQVMPLEHETPINKTIEAHRFFAATMLIPASIFLAVAVITALWRN